MRCIGACVFAVFRGVVMKSWAAAALITVLSTVAIAPSSAQTSSSVRIGNGSVGNGSAYELWRLNQGSSFQLRVWRGTRPSSASPTCTYNFASNRDAMAFWRDISRLQGCPQQGGQVQSANPVSTTRSSTRSSPQITRNTLDIDCIETVPGIPTAAQPAALGSAALGNVEREILAMVNAERQKVGVRPLSLNSRLTTAAQRHAEDMARTGQFSHTGSNGSSVRDRATASGYRSSYVGENIGMGYINAAAVMSGWMNSPGHRQNILNSNYTELGVGLIQGQGGLYWVQVFGKP